MAIAKWKLMVVNFSGVIYTLLVITAVAILNLSYTCPSLYSETECFWTFIYAIVIITQMGVNLALFHYFNRRNQVSYWMVKSNAFLMNGASLSTSKSNKSSNNSVHFLNDSTKNRRPNGNCSINMLEEDELEEEGDVPRAQEAEQLRLISSRLHSAEREDKVLKHDVSSRPKPSSVQPHIPQQHQLNHYQHLSHKNQLFATTDGRYRREDEMIEADGTSCGNSTHPISPANGNQTKSQTKFCVECNKTTPKRCHHCPICNICVLRKDHHCFLTGGCVGLANQRYFIVFLFWAVIGSAYGSALNFMYLNTFVTPWYPFGWLHYIGPIALGRWFMGMDVFWNMCLAVLFSVSFSSFFGAAVFLFLQMFYTLQGYTMHDYHVSRHQDNLESDGETIKERLALVFGRRWWLNFLFPQFWLPNQMTPGIARNVFMSISKDL